MVYVTVTDEFLSDWGMATNKIVKYVYVCDSMEEAEIVADNAKARGDQKNVNITFNKPYYNSNRYYVTVINKEDGEAWYTPGFFTK